jgi:hypothetical protein
MAAGRPERVRRHLFPCCSEEDVAMTVETTPVPMPDNTPPSLPHRARAGYPQARFADLPKSHEEDGEVPFWPVSPPPLITRIFPGL